MTTFIRSLAGIFVIVVFVNRSVCILVNIMHNLLVILLKLLYIIADSGVELLFDS